MPRRSARGLEDLPAGQSACTLRSRRSLADAAQGAARFGLRADAHRLVARRRRRRGQRPHRSVPSQPAEQARSRSPATTDADVSRHGRCPATRGSRAQAARVAWGRERGADVFLGAQRPRTRLSTTPAAPGPACRGASRGRSPRDGAAGRRRSPPPRPRPGSDGSSSRANPWQTAPRGCLRRRPWSGPRPGQSGPFPLSRVARAASARRRGRHAVLQRSGQDLRALPVIETSEILKTRTLSRRPSMYARPSAS
jgi:hypothetical protein